jgi:hypothetical protein
MTKMVVVSFKEAHFFPLCKLFYYLVAYPVGHNAMLSLIVQHFLKAQV